MLVLTGGVRSLRSAISPLDKAGVRGWVEVEADPELRRRAWSGRGGTWEGIA
jgi:hypothetical protein